MKRGKDQAMGKGLGLGLVLAAETGGGCQDLKSCRIELGKEVGERGVRRGRGRGRSRLMVGRIATLREMNGIAARRENIVIIVDHSRCRVDVYQKRGKKEVVHAAAFISAFAGI